MKRGFLNLFGLMMAAHMANGNDVGPLLSPKIVNSGLSGYTGFTGTNASRKKHFNKKRHGFYLKKSKRKLWTK